MDMNAMSERWPQTKVSLLFYWVCATLSLNLNIARADYRFISGNPYEAQWRLFEDIRSNRVDRSALGTQALDAMTRESPYATTPSKLNELGNISKICLYFGVRNQSEQSVVLRTVHANGCGDWVITSGRTPETVSSMAMVPVKQQTGQPNNCGPPGVLPLPPNSRDNQHFILPPKVSCLGLNEISLPPKSNELDGAYEIFPGMRPNANQ
jgi:hypothetical protein